MTTKKTVTTLCIVFGLIVTELTAQELNDDIKKRLRQSLITPEKNYSHQPLQYTPWLLLEQDNDILKISPFTQLPTKGDRIQLLHPPEEYQIHINTTVTNSTPINQRPTGSVRYWLNGNKLQIESSGGTLVVPSGYGGGPIRKRHKKNTNILKALQK